MQKNIIIIKKKNKKGKKIKKDLNSSKNLILKSIMI